MKFNLIEIRALEQSLVKLNDKELPIRIAFRLGKFLKKIYEELALIEKYRKDLVKKYSNGEDKSGNYEVIKDKEEDFKKEFSELLMEEIDIDFSPISISELGDISLTPVDMIRLDKIIYEDEEKIKD